MNEFNVGDVVFCKTHKVIPIEKKVPMKIQEKLIERPYASEKNPSYLCSWKDSKTNEINENWFKWNEIEK